jgi:hypothetical protein
MKKLLCVVLLCVAGFTAFAQTLYDFIPFGTSSETTFRESYDFFRSQHSAFRRINELPRGVAQVIHNQLRYHMLNVGDVFIAYIIYGSSYYIIYLRITNVPNRTWQFYAFVGG